MGAKSMDFDAKTLGAVDRRAFLRSASRIGAGLIGVSALGACQMNRAVSDRGALTTADIRRQEALAAADDGEPGGRFALSNDGADFRPRTSGEIRSLTLRHRWSDEYVTAIFRRGDDYDREALEVINYIMRDRHENAIVPIDIRLVELMADVQDTLAPSRPIDVLSGYRTPRSNYRLRQRNRSAARNSLHMRAMAIDMRIEGVSTRRLRDFGVGQERGGVGYYPRRGFVHLDVGDVRYWRF